MVIGKTTHCQILGAFQTIDNKRNKIEKHMDNFIEKLKKYVESKLGVVPSHYDEIFEMIATQYAIYKEAQEHIMKNGSLVKNRFGDVASSAAVKLMNDAENHLVALLNECGLTLKSSIKLKLGGGDDNDFINSLVK